MYSNSFIVESAYTIFQNNYKHFLNTPKPCSQLFIPILVQDEFKRKYPIPYDLKTLIDDKLTLLKKSFESIVVFGDSGSGKTSFALNYCQNQFEELKNSENNWLPIYISLIEFNQELNEDGYKNIFNMWVNKHFQSPNTFYKHLLLSKFNILLFLDGYDELWHKKPNLLKPLFKSRNSKTFVVTLCQPIIFKSRIERFEIFRFDEKESSEELFVTKFSRENIDLYVEKFVGYLSDLNDNEPTGSESSNNDFHDIWYMCKQITNETEWEKSSVLYFDWLKIKLPELYSLGERPFILTQILLVLPGVVKKVESQEFPTIEDKIKHMRSMCITEVGIYDEFIKQWFNYQANKIQISQRPKDLYELKADLPKLFFTYAQNLAKFLVKSREGLDFELGVIESDTLKDYLIEPNEPEFIKKIKADVKMPEIFILDPSKDSEKINERRQLCLIALRKGCFITTASKRSDAGKLRGLRDLTFFHQSLTEYFASREMFQNVRAELNYYVRQNFPDEIKLDYLGLNVKPIEKFPIVLHHLVGRVKIDEEFKNMLFEAINQSSKYEVIKQMAANAITILNLAGISLSGKNFNNIQVPGSNLSNSVLSNTDLRGANLINVRLQNACLSNAKFQGANLDNIKFGQLPFIDHKKAYAMKPFIIFNHYDTVSRKEYVFTSYMNGGIIRNCLDLDLTSTNNTKNYDQTEYLQADFQDLIYGGTNIIINSLRKVVGYKPDKKQIFFWDFDTTNQEVGIADIKHKFNEVYFSDNRNWLTYNIDNECIVKESNPVEFKEIDNIARFVADNIELVVWNLRHEINLPKISKYNILVCHYPSIPISLYKLAVFPCNLDFHICLQFKMMLEGIFHGITILTYSENAKGGYGLLVINYYDSFKVLKIGGNTVSCIFIPRTGFGKIKNVVICPGQKFIAYSPSTRSGWLIVTNLERNTEVINDNGAEDYDTSKGLGNPIQTVFNHSSTLMASHFEFDRHIKIWKLEPEYRVCWLVQDIIPYVRYARLSPQFTFAKDGQKIVYYGNSISDKLITILDIDTLDYKNEIRSVGSDLSQEIKILSVSSNWNQLSIIFRECQNVNTYSIPVGPKGSLLHTFKVVEMKKEIKIVEKVFDLALFENGNILAFVRTAPTNYCLKFFQCSGNEFSTPLFEEIEVRRVSFDIKHHKLFVVTCLKLYVVEFSINIDEGKIDAIIKETPINNYFPRTGSPKFFQDPNGLYVGYHYPTTFVTLYLPTIDSKIVVQEVPVSRAEMNYVQACCFGTEKCTKVYCTTLKYIFVYILPKRNNSYFILLRKFPTSGSMVDFEFFNTAIHYSTSLKKLIVVVSSGEFNVIEPKTGKIVLYSKVWHNIFRSMFRDVDAHVEFIVTDNHDSLTCIRLSNSPKLQWEILWSKTSSKTLLATKCNLKNSFIPETETQTLLGQCFSTGIPSVKPCLPSFPSLFLGIIGEKCNEEMEPIFSNCKSESFRLTENLWSICITRKKYKWYSKKRYNIFSNFHMSLIVEGIQGNRRFAIKSDLYLEKVSESAEKEVCISMVPFTTLDVIKKAAENRHCHLIPIDSTKGMILLENIRLDQCDPERTYNLLNQNCITWCEEKLKEIGLKIPKKWYDIVRVCPVPFTQD